MSRRDLLRRALTLGALAVVGRLPEPTIVPATPTPRQVMEPGAAAFYDPETGVTWLIHDTHALWVNGRLLQRVGP